MTSKLSNGRTLAWIMAACLSPVAGHCTNWEFDPRVEVGGMTDDNYRLLPAGYHESVTGMFGDVHVDMRTLDPVNELRFSPGVHATWFPNTSEEDSTDPYAQFYVAHRGARSNAAMTASYTKETVVRSDRAAPGITGGLGNPDTGDSGYISTRNRLQLISVTPSFTQELTQRDALNVNLLYVKASYGRFIPNFNVGYAYYVGDIALSHATTERQSWLIHGLYSRNDPENPSGVPAANSTTNSYGLMGEWRYQVTNIAQAYVRAGAQRSQIQAIGTAPSSNHTNYVAGAGVNWNYQVTQLFLDLTRTVDPSSAGYSTQRSQVRFQVTRNFTPLLSGFVMIRGLDDKAIGALTVFQGRSYAVASVGMEKRFLREWTVRGQYNYSNQQFFGYGLGPERSNMFEVSVVYEPRRETASVGRYQR